MNESKWTHLICWECWDKRNPDRPAHRVNSGHEALCCFCSRWTTSAIYVLENPADMPCNGKHEQEVEA